MRASKEINISSFYIVGCGSISRTSSDKKEVKNLKEEDLEWYKRIIIELLEKQRTQEELKAAVYALNGMFDKKD